MPDAFHHLVSNDNFHCQTPLKNAKFDLFGSEKCPSVNVVANRLANCDSPMLRHPFSGNSKQLQRLDSVHLSSVYTDYTFSSLAYFHNI